LEDRFTHREFDCFLGVGNGNGLEVDVLVDEAAGDRFTLFWETIT